MPRATFQRLQGRAAATGAAREDLQVPGGRMRLAVHRARPDRFLWRLDRFPAQDDAPGMASGRAVSDAVGVDLDLGAVREGSDHGSVRVSLHPRSIRVEGERHAILERSGSGLCDNALARASRSRAALAPD